PLWVQIRFVCPIASVYQPDRKLRKEFLAESLTVSISKIGAKIMHLRQISQKFCIFVHYFKQLIKIMEGKRILYVTTEMIPYFPENPMSVQSLKIPKAMSDRGADVRIFMPRFGVINERRHQLHEVIRLSGMNLIINNMDKLLIIKVSSVLSESLQVYFIDNEEYFKRKSV